MFLEPLDVLERAAIEPLPLLPDFLPRWRALLPRQASDTRRGPSDTAEDRWLREVVERLECPGGLATIARSIARAEDLRAWCRAVVQTCSKAALAAFDEAASPAAGTDAACARRDGASRGAVAHAHAELLDGASLAAQELGRS